MVESVVGKVYGKLTVLAEARVEPKNGKRRVLVRCACEAATEKVIRLGSISSGNTTSCGCVKKTHGLRHHPLYIRWQQIFQRCQNEKHRHYKDYGGRDIAVCERWQKFENFYADMQPTYEEGLTLDRKDNDKGYNPENCRWATATEQARNRRTNVSVTLNGQTQCLAAWCSQLGLNPGTVSMRIYRGRTPEQALTM